MMWVFLGWALGLTTAYHMIPPNNVEYEAKCQNDGFYLDNGTCLCKPYFKGDSCERRVCMNGGRNYDGEKTRCICPSGFLGANCEPRACLGDVKDIFNPPVTKRSATFLFTFTPDMNDKMKKSGDDFLNYTKQQFDVWQYSEINLIIPEKSTIMRIETKKDLANWLDTIFNVILCDEEDGYCPIDFMPYQAVLGAVRQSSPNSPVYIVTNVQLSNDTTDRDNNYQQIIQEATMMGVTISTFLYGPAGINRDTVYSQEGFREYGEFAAATGGFYVTPYNPQQNSLMGSLSVSHALDVIHNVITTSYPIHFEPTPDPTYYYSESGIFYFTFRTNDTADLSFFIQTYSPEAKRIESFDMALDDAGFTKIYTLDLKNFFNKTQIPNPNSMYASLQTTSNGLVRDVRVYGQPSYPLSLAISTATQVDASHPHAVPIQGYPSGPDMLVSAGFNISMKGQKVGNWAITKNDGTMKRNDGDTCLYQSIIGTITSCTQGSTWIQVSDGKEAESTGMIPFYCGDAIYGTSNPPNIFDHLQRNDEKWTPKSKADATKCFEPLPKYVNTGKKIIGFVIEDNPTITNDFLINPGNIFEKLVNIFTPDMIGITNVVNGDKGYTFPATGNIGGVMGNILNNIDSKNPSIKTNFYTAIKNATEINSNATFYDLFVVGLSSSVFEFSTKTPEFDIFADLYKQRIRLHWLWIKDDNPTPTPTPTSAKEFDEASRKLAAGTGGLSHLFDSAKEAARFINNFDWFFGKELVYSQELNDMIEIITPLQLQENEAIYVVLDSPATTTPAVEISGNVLTKIPYSPSDNQMQIFKFPVPVNASKTYYMKIDYPIVNGEHLSIRVYTTVQSLYSIAFASGNKIEKDDMYGPIFGTPIQFPVFATNTITDLNSTTSTFTISLQTNGFNDYKPLQTSGSIVKNGCDDDDDAFAYYFSYNWVCSQPGQIYHLQLSEQTTWTTRTFSFVCNQENPEENNFCGAHGEPYKDSKSLCECKAGWTGRLCDMPDCQNDGIPLNGGTCDCPSNTRGFFCEYDTNKSCLPEDVTFPEYRSKIGSLIFVIEESPSVWNKIEGWINNVTMMSRDQFEKSFQSTQIVLVTYGSDGVKSRLATTDPKSLKNALDDGTTWDDTYDGTTREQALITALNLQTTDRSLLIWVTASVRLSGQPTNDTQRELFKLIADRRADIRIYIADQSTPPGGDSLLNKLGLISVSIPIQLTAPTDFQQVINNYIYPSLPRDGQFAPILTTIDYSSDCSPGNKTLFIPKNSGWFLSTIGLTVTEVTPTPTPTYIVSGLQSFASLVNGASYTFTFTPSTPSTPSAPFTPSTAPACGYSIEVLGEEQVAFGIASNDKDQESLSPVMNAQYDNYMNIKWNGAIIPPYTDPESSYAADFFQNAQQWTVTENGKALYTINYTIPGINRVALNHNFSDTQCLYPFLPKMLSCEDGTEGFVIRINAPSSEDETKIVQKMTYMPCIDLTTWCKNGNYNGEICLCKNGWSGYDCTIPTCEHGGIRDGTVCNCLKGFIGPFCKQYDPCTPKSSRTIMFLFDPTVSANDQGILAANDSLGPLRDAIMQTANLYDVAGKKAFMGLGEMRLGKYESVADSSHASVILDSWNQTSNSWKIGIDDIVDEIMGVHEKVDLRRLFILTKQKNINPKLFNNDQQLQRLKDFGYEIMVVGFETDVSQLSSWGSTTTVQTAEEFVNLAIEFNEGSDCPETTTIAPTTVITPTPKYEFCTQNSRLDIMFMVDGCFSNQEDITLVYDVLTNFYSGLATTKQISNASDFCTNETQWNEWNTRVIGQAYYNNTYKGLVPQFCQDQSTQFASTVKGLKITNSSKITSMKTIVTRTNIFMEQKCVCRRWTNESEPDYNVTAPQIMIWLPLTANYSEEATEFLRTQLYSFDHYLLPYKFSQNDADVGPNSIWTKMKEINLTTPTMSRQKIVQALWDLVCNITGAPGETPIAPDDWTPPEILLDEDFELNSGNLKFEEENDPIERNSKQEETPQILSQNRFGFRFLGWDF